MDHTSDLDIHQAPISSIDATVIAMVRRCLFAIRVQFLAIILLTRCAKFFRVLPSGTVVGSAGSGEVYPAAIRDSTKILGEGMVFVKNLGGIV